MAVTTKHREPRHTKKLPVLCSRSNPEVVATTYKNRFNGGRITKIPDGRKSKVCPQKEAKIWMDRAREESSHIQTTVGFAGNLGRIRGTAI
jgi:hypothetical protein